MTAYFSCHQRFAVSVWVEKASGAGAGHDDVSEVSFVGVNGGRSAACARGEAEDQQGAVGRAAGVEKAQVAGGEGDARFFMQFACAGLLPCLPHADEPAGQGQFAGLWRVGPAHQQQARVHRQQDDRDGQRVEVADVAADRAAARPGQGIGKAAAAVGAVRVFGRAVFCDMVSSGGCRRGGGSDGRSSWNWAA